MPYIGDIYIPSLESMEPENRKKHFSFTDLNSSNILPGTVDGKSEIMDINIDGYLFSEGSKNANDYAEDLISTMKREPFFNKISYSGFSGFFIPESINIPNNVEMYGLRKFTAKGKFLPDKTNIHSLTTRYDVVLPNEWFVNNIPLIPLPVGATNVCVRGDYDTISLSPMGTVTGPDGTFNVYRPYLMYDADNYSTLSSGGVISYQDATYKHQTINLDANGEYVQWSHSSHTNSRGLGQDLPRGKYKLKVRVKDSNVANDIKLTVYYSDGSTKIHEAIYSTSSTDYVILETPEFDLNWIGYYFIRITKNSATTNNIYVNYCYLEPVGNQRIIYDISGNEIDNGECKVYDTVTHGNTIESTWKRIYNTEHKFTGDIIFENALMRWFIKTDISWYSSYNTTNGYIYYKNNLTTHYSSLIPYFFSNDSPNIKINKISSHIIDLSIYFVNGTSSSSTTDDKLTVSIKINPLIFYIENKIYGDYKYGWKLNSKEDDQFSYYILDNITKDKTESSATLTSKCKNTIKNYCSISLNISNKYVSYNHKDGFCYTSSSTAIPSSGLYSELNFSVFTCPINHYYDAYSMTYTIDEDRKFFKDDFTSNTISDYTQTNFSCSNGNLVINSSGINYCLNNRCNYGSGKYVTTFQMNYVEGGSLAQWMGLIFGATDTSNGYRVGFHRASGGTWDVTIRKTSSWTTIASTLVTTPSTGDYIRLEVIWNTSSGSISVTVTNITTGSSWTVSGTDTTYTSGNFGVFGITSNTNTFSEIIYYPTIAYSDDFSLNTTGRFMVSSGTFTYNTVNCSLTSSASGTTTVFLKSYKFGSGYYKCKVTLNTANAEQHIMILFGNVCMDHTVDTGINHYRLKFSRASGSDSWTPSITYRKDGVITTLVTGTPIAADGQTMVFELEFNSETGEIYGYIYNSTGVKPYTPTVKAYSNIFKYGNFGVYYINYDTSTRIVYLDDIEIRAQCLIGETNVPQTEEFFFLDEFNEDSSKRINNDNASYWSYNSTDKALRYTGYAGTAQNFRYFNTLGEIGGNITLEYLVKLTSSGSTDTYCRFILPIMATYNTTLNSISVTNGYYIYGASNESGADFIRFYKDTVQVASNTSVTITEGNYYKIKYTYDGVSLHTVYIVQSDASWGGTYGSAAFTYTDSTYIKGYFGIGAYPGCSSYILDIKGIKINGTRYYNKPILRGVQLGEYYNGTNIENTIRIADDFCWYTMNEYTFGTNGTKSISYGRLKLTSSASGNWVCMKPTTTLGIAEGFISFKFKNNNTVSETKLIELSLFNDGNVSTNYFRKGYSIGFNCNTGYVYVRDNQAWTHVQTNASVFNTELNNIHTVTVRITGTTTRTIEFYIDGKYINSYTTPSTPTYYGYGFAAYCATPSNMDIILTDIICDFKDYELFIYDTINSKYVGDGAVIGGVGHGARYDIEEMIYKDITTLGAGIYSVIYRVKSSIASSTSDYLLDAMFYNVTDGTTISIETSSLSDKMTITTNATEYKEDIRIKGTDISDVIRIGAKRRNYTLYNAPYSIIDFVHIINRFSESSTTPIGIGDLEWTSDMKPCKLFNVEVK